MDITQSQGPACENDDHIHLVDRGLELHEARKYDEAISVFRVAEQMSPRCPVVAYNLANTLHMLDRSEESIEILRSIIDSSEAQLLALCSDASPRSLRLDALYLMFLSLLDASGSWRKASPYLRKHLANRSRGLFSVFTKARVLNEAEGLRAAYAPRAKPVSGKSL